MQINVYTCETFSSSISSETWQEGAERDLCQVRHKEILDEINCVELDLECAEGYITGWREGIRTQIGRYALSGLMKWLCKWPSYG